VDLTKTSALDPGNSIKIFTLGGAISGNCDMGDKLIASKPINTIQTEKDIARTGLFINLLNIIFSF
jgi:hypothetical protein